jgi:hypothetical protein
MQRRYHREGLDCGVPARFIDVVVKEHDELPDGCRVRFRALGDARPVSLVRYAPRFGQPGDFRVEARDTTGAATAQATMVDDSHTRTPTLIWGGDLGLRLHRIAETETVAEPVVEPYLLLAPEAILA